MTRVGQTALLSTSLPLEQIDLLRSLWIETAEEAIAVAATVAASDQAGSAPLLGALSSGALVTAVPGDILKGLRQTSRGGALGCLVDPPSVDAYKARGRLRMAQAQPAGAFDGELPREIRLLESMQPVRDQGERGTCVAFAAVALREFLLQNTVGLSEQFVYWGCKELDGSNGPGTWIHTAMSVFAQYGVCSETDWPYNPSQTDREGQEPPPPAVLAKAQALRLASTRTVEPGLVLHYKQVLAGDAGKGGMPVVFGVLVFNSWLMSAESRRAGKITLPLPGEEPVGGHAMCVVGYVDNPAVPGGGYFIVRNSWGPKWAAESSEAAGHALMPYEYVERFAMEAFTGPSTGPADKLRRGADDWTEFARTLEKDQRDIDGRLLSRGTKVLASPAEPDAIKEDTPQSRQVFLRQQRTWTSHGRVQAWFPAKADWPAEFASSVERASAARQQFHANIKENLDTSIGARFPDPNNLPWPAALVPWQSKIRKVECEVDLSVELASILLRESGHPTDMVPPKEWEQAHQAASLMRVYRVHGFFADLRVVIAFVAPLVLRSGAKPTLGVPTAGTVETLRTLVAQHLAMKASRDPLYTVYSLGSLTPWPDDVKVTGGGDGCTLLSQWTEDNEWKTKAPAFFASRKTFRDFLDRVYPVRQQDVISTIKKAVDRKFTEAYEGSITVRKLAKELGRRQSTVRDAFLTMQEISDYRVEKYADTQTGTQELRILKSADRPKLSAATFNRGFFSRHFFLFISAAVGVGAVLGREALVRAGRWPEDRIWDLLALVSFTYLTGLVQSRINQRASEEKE